MAKPLKVGKRVNEYYQNSFQTEFQILSISNKRMNFRINIQKKSINGRFINI